MNKIRQASHKDIDRIINLLTQVCNVHHKARPDIFQANKQKYTEKQLMQILKDNDKAVFVSVDEADYVEGYVFCEIKNTFNDNVLVSHKSIYIDDLCVDEKARGKHIGKDLYEFVLEYAKSIGCYNVTLNVWTCNIGALKFYEKCGLVPQKIVMEKIL